MSPSMMKALLSAKSMYSPAVMSRIFRVNTASISLATAVTEKGYAV